MATSTHFELVTVRLRDAAGVEGVGYTYTVGKGGAAVAALIERGLSPMLLGAEPDRIEALWQRMWWTLHYGGRGGSASLAVSAVDIALWDLKARRFETPLWRLLGGYDPHVPAYAGGIDLDFPLDRLLRQTDDNLDKRVSCDQDEGWPPAIVAGSRAGGGDARASRRRFSADGGRQYALERRRGGARRAPRLPSSASSGSRNRPSPTMSRATGGSSAMAGCRSPPAKTCTRSTSSSR